MRRILLVVLAACSDPAATPDGGIDAPPGGSVQLEVVPAGHDFGELELGVDGLERPTVAFAIRNVSAVPVDIAGLAIGGANPADFAIVEERCPASLEPGASCTATIQFVPTGRDVRMAQLEVGGTETTAQLQGTGLVRGQRLVFSPASRNFGDVPVGALSPAVTFTILNEAVAGPLTPSLAGPAADNFEVVASDCGNVIPLHGTCTATVQMAPLHGGSHVAAFHLSVGNETFSAGLVGSTTSPLGLLPHDEIFDSFLVGQPEPGETLQFTVSNPTSTNSGALTPTLEGQDAADFTIAGTTCSTTLAPAQSCTVDVRFAPATRGGKDATLVVTDATSSITTKSSLRASAYVATIATSGMFAATAVNQSTTKVFTVVNPSARATGAIATVLTGAMFSITSNTCAAGIAPVSGCEIVVRFAPTSAGTKMGTLQISASPGGSDTEQLSGVGQ